MPNFDSVPFDSESGLRVVSCQGRPSSMPNENERESGATGGYVAKKGAETGKDVRTCGMVCSNNLRKYYFSLCKIGDISESVYGNQSSYG